MLLEAGYPIKDASQEVERLRARAEQEAAVRMADATARRGREEDDDQEEDDGSGSAEVRKPVGKVSEREPVEAGR
jgi:hypothetical protein